MEPASNSSQFTPGELIGWAFAVSFLTNVGGFLITAVTRSHKITDLLGSASFLAIAIVTMVRSLSEEPRQLALLIVILVWGVRLGVFLLVRVIKLGDDARLRMLFPKVDSDEGFCDRSGSLYPARLAVFWTMQSLWSAVTMIPATLALGSYAQSPNQLFHPGTNGVVLATDIIALFLSIFGFLVETTADIQKYNFKNRNPSQFMSSGLFSVVRYPNYAGEMTFWTGIYFLCLPVIFPTYLRLVALISPLFVVALIFKVSGINMLEKSSRERYGSDPAFVHYVESTNKLVPNPFQIPVGIALFTLVVLSFYTAFTIPPP